MPLPNSYKRKKWPLESAIPENQGEAQNHATDFSWWRDRNTLLMLGVVLLVTFMAMSPALKGKFVGWDDDVNVYENEHVKNLSLTNVKVLFTSPVSGNYNPLTNLTFAVEYHLFGEDPFYFHLNNIILHLFNTFLVFILMILLGMRKPWAILAALLFGIHPMRVESVAWITERKDVLFGFFYLLASVSYVYHYKTGKKRYVFFTFLFFMLSLLSKIQAVSLPLTLLLYDFVLDRPLKSRLIIEKIPYFVLSLVVGVAGIYLLHDVGSFNLSAYEMHEKILVGTNALFIYLVKSIVPFEMAPIYPFPEPGGLGWFYYCTPFILAIIGYLVYWTLNYTRAIVFGALFFLVNIMFVLQVVPAGQGFLADRFSYIPYAGLFYIYAFSLSLLYERQKKLKPLIIASVIIVAVIYSGLSRSQSRVWKDTETLFTHEQKYYKDVAIIYRNRGNFYRDSKQYDKAINDFTYLLWLKPTESAAYVSRGKQYFETGQYAKATDDYTQAIKYDPGNKEAYDNRGAIYALMKQYDLALADLDKALNLDPEMKDAMLNRALLFFNTNDFEKSLKDLDHYLALEPANAASIDMRGLCYFNLNQFDKALVDFNSAISIMQNEPVLYQHRASAYLKVGNKADAYQDLLKARELGGQIDPILLDSIK